MSLANEPSALYTVLFAAEFAAHKHREQRRRDQGASPYINHPLALASLLASHQVTDPVTLAAAILHDTVEDTDTSPAEIERLFGAAVAAVVLEVTDDKALPKAERKRLQIAKAAGKSDRAKLVKIADKICNLRDLISAPPVEWSVERRLAYFAWAKQVVDEMRGVHPTLEACFDEVYQAGSVALAA